MPSYAAFGTIGVALATAVFLFTYWRDHREGRHRLPLQGRGHQEQQRRRCNLCGSSGNAGLIQCQNCPETFHNDCAVKHLRSRPDGTRVCRNCRVGVVETEEENNKNHQEQLHGRCHDCNRPILDARDKIECQNCEQNYHYKCATNLPARNDQYRECKSCKGEIETNERGQQEQQRRQCILCGSSGNARLIQCQNCPETYHNDCAVKHLRSRPDGIRVCRNCRVGVVETVEEDDKGICIVCHDPSVEDRELINCEHCKQVYHSFCAEALPNGSHGKKMCITCFRYFSMD